MPTNNPPPSSQGSIVTFDGAQLGRLTDFQAIAGTARFEEVTNVLSRVVGTGDAARVVSQYECLGIDPGGANITMRDVPPYILDDIGARGTLTVSMSGGTLVADAFLETFDVAGSVGEFLRGTARFRFSGT
jgi:hypothetical protein